MASNPIKEIQKKNRANSLEVRAKAAVQVILQMIQKERAKPAAKGVNILTAAHRNRKPLTKAQAPDLGGLPFRANLSRTSQ